MHKLPGKVGTLLPDFIASEIITQSVLLLGMVPVAFTSIQGMDERFYFTPG
jgi:hypothetical protein